MDRMLKRLVSLVIVLCTVALFSFCPKADATPVLLTAKFDKTSYATGETAVLTLNLSGVTATPVSAFDFSLGFKSKVLKVESVSKTVTSFSALENVPVAEYLSLTAPKSNKIRVLYLDESTNQSAPIKTDGDFCTITFTVQKKATLGSHTMMLDNDGSFSDTNMNPCKVKMQDTDFVVQKNIGDCTFSKINTRTYSGKKIKPKLTITDNGTTLVKNEDYTISHKDNLNVGKATITVTGKGDYLGVKKITFKINPLDVSKCVISKIPNQYWKNKRIKPAVAVTVGTKAMVQGTDFTVKFKNNKKIGTATATITGLGNLKGSYQTTFKILPNPVTVKTALSQRAGNVNISIKKSRGAGGYQIQYNFTGKWSKAKKVDLKKNRTFNLENRKSGKKFYYRIRSYRKVGSKYYYSPYTKKKYIEIL